MGMYTNGREIINDYIGKFRRNPSEYLAQRIEALSGIVADFGDGRGERKLPVTIEYDVKGDQELGEILTKYY